MKNLLIILAVVVSIASCSRAGHDYNASINEAEKLMQVNTDSAMTILDAIEPTDLRADSVRAKYYFLKAFGHMRQNRSMISDSLISFAHDYYRGKDMAKDIRSGMAYAWYKFWVGDTRGAIAMLDSLINVPDVPDSLAIQPLRIRTLLGASEYQGTELIPLAQRLIALEIDTLRKQEATYVLVTAYEFAEKADSALVLINELQDYASSHNWGDKQFLLELEQAQILTELGREAESDFVIDEIFRKSSSDNGAADYLHMQYALNALNTGNTSRAARELAIADSFAIKLRGNEDIYYRSYSNLIRAIMDFKQNGRVKLVHINSLNNRQLERYNRMKASQWESERGALQQQSRALALKAESRRKTIIITVTAFVALMLLAAAACIIWLRRSRERDKEERIEALQKMVDEFKSAPVSRLTDNSSLPALRRAMLQQLGIIRMVAETPTEQNREMLRKISSINGETNGELVNWPNVYELIDNLYSNFYRKLHNKYGDVLNNKEEQIIALLVAGFSTKEISVITGQTTSTIYVRKSSIRKKLGVPEKEDIVTFLRETGNGESK